MKTGSTNLGKPLMHPLPSKRISKGWFAWFFSFAASALGGGLIGLSWHESHIPLIGLAGIFGLGIILYVQLKTCSISRSIGAALVAGYASFLISETWIPSTAQSLTESSSMRALAIGHCVHLWHGGIFVVFSFAYWLLRRSLRGGWMLAPIVWVACESVYPLLYPAKQGSLLLDVHHLTQITSLTGVAGASFQVMLIALTIAAFMFWLEHQVFGSKSLAKIEPENKASAFHEPAFYGPAFHHKLGIWVWATLLIPTAANGIFGAVRIHQSSLQDAPSFKAVVGDKLLTIRPQIANTVDSSSLRLVLLQSDTEYATFHLDLMKLSRIHATGSDLLVWPECSVGKYNQQLTDFADDNRVLKMRFKWGIGFALFPIPRAACWRAAILGKVQPIFSQTQLSQTQLSQTQPPQSKSSPCGFLLFCLTPPSN